ncbi:MAG TPA: FtsX-like permease family protein [Streptosporangiaceae bacterium]|nr:FtsX-like permease family protein [Streptosporangiaceae bacterium]
MLSLGLRLTLRSGREALVRLVITAAAVAVGVALLLGVLAEFHAFQANANQPCWSCTTGASVPSPLPSHGELWNDSVDFYQGQTITRLDVAPLGADAPVPPGITRLPAPGEYYASPALAALLKTVPADELGDRFPGHLAGTIGDAALNGANDLVIYIGYTPAALAPAATLPPSKLHGPATPAAVPGTTWVTSIATAPAQEVFTPFFRYAFGVGVLAVLFPMLVLISTATRLAADRREERFAALRLVGGTPADIRVIASVESVVSAFCGAVLGVAIFLLVRPALAGAALTGTQYFESQLTPAVWGYLAMLVGVPVAAAVAALISLRRVQVSPLGVSRRATPKPPTFWRLAPLVLGLGLYVYGLSKTTHKSIGAPAYPGLLVTMIGLVIAGPWLTSVASRLFGRLTPGSSALLSTRRLADNPNRAFRAVTGLVLAVFLGTMVGTLVPAVNGVEATPTAGALSNVLLDSGLNLSPHAGAELLSGLNAIKGADVYPIYASLATGPASGPGIGPSVMTCPALRGLAVLGQCAPGLQAVEVTDNSLYGDNPIYDTAPIASAASPAYPGDLAKLSLITILVRVDSPATLERVRTYLAVNTAPAESGSQGSAPTPPRTFGETLQIRLDRAATFEKIVYAAVALTLIVAGCSLAVAVGGGLVDRKRPFTLLRVSGTPVGVLSRVVLMEAAVPLGVCPARAGRDSDPAARVGLLRPAGHRPGRRVRGHHGDAPAAAPHDKPRQRPLRVASPGADLPAPQPPALQPASAPARPVPVSQGWPAQHQG